MARYTDLPTMRKPGAGPAILSRALKRIEPAHRGNVLAGLDVPDAAVVDNGGPRLSVQFRVSGVR